jgi:hypothetical protein
MANERCRILKTALWLQRSQMFIDSAASHFLALQRSAMFCG